MHPRSTLLAFTLLMAGCVRASNDQEDTSKQARGPVKMTQVPSNGGWMIHFEIPEPTERVFYRVEPDTEFEEVQQFIWLPLGDATTKILVKYEDVDGAMHGPFEFHHEPLPALIEHSKQALGFTGGWVYLDNRSGTKLIHWSGVLTYRCGLEAVAWGVNTMTPTMSYDPGVCDVNDPYSHPDDISRLYSYLPDNTDFVSVQLVYVDGTKSKVQRFDRFNSH